MYTYTLIYAYKTGHTFVLRCELFHDHGKRLVEPLLLGYKRFANCVVIILHHAHVASNLVDKWLQQDSFPSIPNVQIILHHHGAARGIGVFLC